MSEEELELLVTIDDPVDPPEEDTFHHLEVDNLDYWLGRRFPASRVLDKKTEADIDATSL